MGTVSRANAASSGQVLSTTRTGTPPWTGGVYQRSMGLWVHGSIGGRSWVHGLIERRPFAWTHGPMDLWTCGPVDLWTGPGGPSNEGEGQPVPVQMYPD